MPQGPPDLPGALFSNPGASITSLEAAVRHDWDASTARGKDSIGLKLTCHIFLALTGMFATSATSQLRADHTNLLQHITDSSKSPALLSLLLSCVKQLQHNCQQNPQGPLRMVSLSAMAAAIAAHLVTLCTTSSGRVQGMPEDSSRAMDLVPVTAQHPSAAAALPWKACTQSPQLRQHPAQGQATSPLQFSLVWLQQGGTP